MKGFVHIVETTFAILILVFALYLSFSQIKIKPSLETFELVISGTETWKCLESSGKYEEIFKNRSAFLSELETALPELFSYGIEVENVPKQAIRIGCANCTLEALTFAENLFTPVYYNKRWVNFSVENFSFISLKDAKIYDMLLFINYTHFDTNPLIREYLKNGGKILAITDIICQLPFDPLNPCDNFLDMDETFLLNISMRGISGKENFQEFEEYNPYEKDAQKHFLGFGFNVNCSYKIGGKKQGYWVIWENSTQVNITPQGDVEIEGVGKLKEGDIFLLNAQEKNPSLPNKYFAFRIKKVFSDEVFIQPLNTSFPFPDFREISATRIEVPVVAKEGAINLIMGEKRNYSLAVMNLTKHVAWLSFFPKSDEFNTLARAIAASMNEKFTYKSYFGTAKKVVLSFFIPQCCDVPEVAEIKLILGYKC